MSQELRSTCGMITAAVLFSTLACAPTTNDRAAMELAGEELGALTTRLQEAMLLRHDMTEFAEVATEDYVAMIPGGRLETKTQVIQGASNFNVESVEFADVMTRIHDVSAVVTGTWTVVGYLGTNDMSGNYGFVWAYEWADGSWRLVAESITRHRSSMAAALSG